MTKISSRIILVFLLLGLSACGFQLRGSSMQTLGAESVFISASNAQQIDTQLRARLSLDEVRVVSSPSEADLVINLSGEEFDRRVLAVDADTGKVREYELGYEVTVSVSRRGEELLESESIELLRDFTFDETAVLGSFSEEGVLQREIAEDAADILLRRIQAVGSQR